MMRTAVSIMIDVSPSDFYKLHGGLVRVLRALEVAGPQGLSTRKVSEQVFNSHSYGVYILKQAYDLGYIRRKIEPRQGPGHPYTMNYLAEKGRKLLQEFGK
jgi:hypothetical protein